MKPTVEQAESLKNILIETTELKESDFFIGIGLNSLVVLLKDSVPKDAPLEIDSIPVEYKENIGPAVAELD